MKAFLRLLVLSLLFFTPLVFTTSTQEVFEFPKMFFVYIVNTLLLAVFLISRVFQLGSSYKPKFPPLYILTFLTIFTFSTIFSVHTFTSIWGYYTRFNGGLISVLVFFGFYYVVSSVFSRGEKTDLLQLSLLPLIPVSIYGIIQHFGFSPITWKANPEIRVFSSFGQPNWLAQYLVMLLPLTIYISLIGKRKLFWSLGFILGFSCLWFTYSISGILSFIVSLLVLGAVLYRDKLLDKSTAKHLLLLLTISLVIGVTNPGIFRDRIHDVIIDFKKMFGVVRVYALEDEYSVSDPGMIRSGMWNGSWALITSSTKNFIIGTGPETFPYAFQPFRPKEVNYSSEWNYVLNKPHNYYLELWAEVGIFGLVSYLVLIGWMWRGLPAMVKPGLAAFLVTNFFGWPVVATSLVWWFWLSLVEVADD